MKLIYVRRMKDYHLKNYVTCRLIFFYRFSLHLDDFDIKLKGFAKKTDVMFDKTEILNADFKFLNITSIVAILNVSQTHNTT
jgi:hypothetical protein